MAHRTLDYGRNQGRDRRVGRERERWGRFRSKRLLKWVRDKERLDTLSHEHVDTHSLSSLNPALGTRSLSPHLLASSSQSGQGVETR